MSDCASIGTVRELSDCTSLGTVLEYRPPSTSFGGFGRDPFFLPKDLEISSLKDPARIKKVKVQKKKEKKNKQTNRARRIIFKSMNRNKVSRHFTLFQRNDQSKRISRFQELLISIKSVVLENTNRQQCSIACQTKFYRRRGKEINISRS